MLATRQDAEMDGITVPMTLQEYCITAQPHVSATGSSSSSYAAAADLDFYVDDDDDYDVDDEDDDDDDECEHCSDSGHGVV